jgi:hypothetical protein
VAGQRSFASPATRRSRLDSQTSCSRCPGVVVLTHGAAPAAVFVDGYSLSLVIAAVAMAAAATVEAVVLRGAGACL